MRNEGFVTQKCKFSVELSGRLQDHSITDALSISLPNVRLKPVFNKQLICLKDKPNLVFTGMASYFIFVTYLYYSFISIQPLGRL